MYVNHSDVHAAFECMSVILMYTLHLGIPQLAEAVVVYKKYYVACVRHCKLVCNEEDTPCCRAG